MIPKPAYQFKFVLVGDSSVGKSSLLTRFVDDSFDDNLLATIGVDFKFRRIKINNQQVKIQIWDTAGQETFRSLVSAYYHSADAILIVYDMTEQKSFQSILEYWIKEAENNNRNNASIFLIGNKSDQGPTKIDPEMQAMLSRHHVSKCFEVSAKKGDNVENSFTEICKVLIAKANALGKQNHNGEGVQKSLKTGDLKQQGEKKKCCG